MKVARKKPSVLRVLAGGIVASVALLGLPGAPDLQGMAARKWVVVLEAPSEFVVHEIAEHLGVDVRWVERDLVVAEVERPEELSVRWGARVVAQRGADRQLALLRERDLQELRAEPDVHAKSLSYISASRVAVASAGAGDVWILIGEPGRWPQEVLGCHGGLVLPKHHIDPRSLLDSGPPRALLPWVLAPRRAWTRGEIDVLESVSEESLSAYYDLLIRDEIGLPADRYVFSDDLDELYGPRAEAVMQRVVQGIPGAVVERQHFGKSRFCPGGGVVVDSTYNLVARLPGSVPGTGTFVVCAHIDATGSRNRVWRERTDTCFEFPPAVPGAEDNATGVASVLEILRCVADGVRSGQLDFAIDLEFIAFSGEEAEGIEGALTGSQRYVEQQVAAGATLLGAFNMDMVGSDSLGNNLEIVHNTSSRWMADWVIESVSMVDPPIDLTCTADLDETLASDHNSFWSVNAPAILGADAPVDVLRRYASYHKPIDTGADVRTNKLREVTRALLAALLRFNTEAHTESRLLFPEETLTLLRSVQGQGLEYNRSLRLWPGAPLEARLSVFSLGATYEGPVHVEMWTQHGDATRPLFDDASQRSVPTGSRLDFQQDV
ncbi:MAG: M28 family metallopeptidase, partial [Candidatus Krumholzibacteriia bacterium]